MNILVKKVSVMSSETQEDIKTEEIIKEPVIEEKIKEETASPVFLSQKRKFFKLAFNSKWAIITVLVTSLLSGFSFYVALHPNLIWEAANYPYAILFLAAIPATIFVISLVINFSKAIKEYLKIQIDKLRESRQSAWFNFAIVCFILVSMAESGTFFGSLIKNLYFGYFVVLTVDICAVQFMDARKKALMHSDETKASRYMIGVWFTVIISAFANAYSSLLNFDLPKDTVRIPEWMGHAAPYIGVIFPLLIVFLAYTVDAELSSKDVVTRYEDQEDIRIRLLEAQERAFTKQFEIKSRIALIAQKQSIFKNIFFTKNKMLQVADLVVEKLQTDLDEKIQLCLSTTTQKLLEEQTQLIENFRQEFYHLPDRIVSQEKLIEEKILQVNNFLQDIDNLKQQVQSIEEPKQVKLQLQEKTIVTEDKSWDIKRVKAREVGYSVKEPQATIGNFTFVPFEEAIRTWDNNKITVDMIQKAYRDHLIDAKYFRIVITTWGKNEKDNHVILLHPEVKKALLQLR